MRRRTKPAAESPVGIAAESSMGLVDQCKNFWKFLRQVTGDDAYERYRAHHASCHGASVHRQGSYCGEAPLSRQQFFKLRQDEKWSRVSRCC